MAAKLIDILDGDEIRAMLLIGIDTDKEIRNLTIKELFRMFGHIKMNFKNGIVTYGTVPCHVIELLTLRCVTNKINIYGD